MKRIQFILLSLLLAYAVSALAHVRPLLPKPLVSGLDGQFLVASRTLRDPNFSRTVIFIVSHSGEGALGLVVNRVLGSIALKDLFDDPGIGNAGTRKVELHYGGPVEFNRGFVLHSDDYTGAGTQVFRNGIALTAGMDIVRAVAAGHGPKRYQFLSGYAGWGARQLDHEIARGDWLVAPADPQLLFSADPANVWEKALRQAGIAL